MPFGSKSVMATHTHANTSGSFKTADTPENSGKYAKYYSDIIDNSLDGFIHHPAGSPIEFRRIWFGNKHVGSMLDGEGNIGVCFESDKYFKPGTILEISIPLRGEQQKFRGKVVLVKNKGDLCEIGLWLTSKADSGRIRIVEQICHIESYLRQKRHREGPFVSKERVAQEWISKFASNFPSFG